MLHFIVRSRQVAESKMHAAFFFRSVCSGRTKEIPPMLHNRVGKERIERKEAGSPGSFRPDDAQCVTKDIRSGGGVTTGHKDLTDGDDMVYVCVLTQCRLLEGTISHSGDLCPAPHGTFFMFSPFK